MSSTLKNETTVLLTGATGLLGSYLLAGLLRRRIPTVVLARGNSFGSANQRIEAVIRQFEDEELLPRPKIIVGDLQQSNCGIEEADLRWLRRQSLLVIHSAASLKFEFETGSGEPYRTNVDGLRKLLATVEALQVEALHYVSTAYVGDRRQARNFEMPITSLEGAENDYERSKIEAERIVGELESVAVRFIHRPSIIVGDSQSGFTSTFHGFYAPLQLGVKIAELYGFSRTATEAFKQGLGLNDDDTKNLVPVDWVAEGIVETVLSNWRSEKSAGNGAAVTSQSAGQVQILHWTNPHGTPVSRMQQALNDVLQERFASPPGEAVVGFDEAVAGFRQALQVYKSYFDADPEFDRRQAAEQLPDLKCPKLDLEYLKRLGYFAVDSNFGWPRPRLPEPPTDSIDQRLHELEDWVDLQGLLPGLSASGDINLSIFELSLLGPNAPPCFHFSLDCSEAEFENGADSKWPSGVMRFELSLESFRALLTHKTDIAGMIRNGSAVLLGDVPKDWEVVIRGCIREISVRLKS